MKSAVAEPAYSPCPSGGRILGPWCRHWHRVAGYCVTLPCRSVLNCLRNSCFNLRRVKVRLPNCVPTKTLGTVSNFTRTRSGTSEKGYNSQRLTFRTDTHAMLDIRLPVRQCPARAPGNAGTSIDKTRTGSPDTAGISRSQPWLWPETMMAALPQRPLGSSTSKL